MKRRRVFVVQSATFAVMVASAVLGWSLTDAEGSLAAVRAGLFGVFTLAAFTLFVAVLVDFDRWVDDVRPYPKRAIRGRAGQGGRAIARLGAGLLAGYAAVMTWVWSRVGATVAWALGGIGAGLTWSWVRLGNGMSRVLVPYRAGAGRLWSAAGAGSAWALGQAGMGLTSLWVWLTRWGAWLLVRFRTAMTLLWGWAGAALWWALRGAGATLTLLWVWLARVGVSVAVGCGEGIRRLWHTTIGGARGAPTIRRKSWYTTAVDSVFGIPPHDTSRDAPRRPRASRRPGSGRRGRVQRPTFRDDESIGTPRETRATADTPGIGEPGARSVGRRVTRRGERRKSEELLSAALARFRSAVKQPRDRDAGRDA